MPLQGETPENTQARCLCYFINFAEQNLFCIINASCLPDDSDFDLSGVVHFLFYALADVPCEHLRFRIIYFSWLDNDADFAAGLEGVARFDATELAGYFFQLVKPFQVQISSYAPCSGP